MGLFHVLRLDDPWYPPQELPLVEEGWVAGPGVWRNALHRHSDSDAPAHGHRQGQCWAGHRPAGVVGPGPQRNAQGGAPGHGGLRHVPGLDDVVYGVGLQPGGVPVRGDGGLSVLDGSHDGLADWVVAAVHGGHAEDLPQRHAVEHARRDDEALLGRGAGVRLVHLLRDLVEEGLVHVEGLEPPGVGLGNQHRVLLVEDGTGHAAPLAALAVVQQHPDVVEHGGQGLLESGGVLDTGAHVVFWPPLLVIPRQQLQSKRLLVLAGLLQVCHDRCGGWQQWLIGGAQCPPFGLCGFL
mmetsp:Transcript_17563/g.31186  ORF Transcript_17563/g.31186 Transcript_17563/m.31186 type:complete len:295 (+) Transcript_17563:490-1374(+)